MTSLCCHSAVMQIDGYVQALREDLARIAAVGDESTARAAELLAGALESALGRRLLEALDEAYTARISLRLPESLKVRLEAAAARDGVSVNTWLVQALMRHAHSEPRPSSGGSRRRLTGYGRS